MGSVMCVRGVHATLVVSDEPSFRARMLEMLPGRTLAVTCIEEGLRTTEEWQPSVILLDEFYRGSERTGTESATLFKERCQNCKIIITTSHYTPCRAQHALLGETIFTVVPREDPALLALVSSARATQTEPYRRLAAALH
jgi:CheY-like chemotaxis protein